MVEVEKDYGFDGPNGTVSLIDLFEGRAQLIIYHFMFHPEWEEGCSSCTAGTDEISVGFLEHLHTRDTTFAIVSRAPLSKLERVEGQAGLGPSLVFLRRLRLQLRLWRHDRLVPRLRYLQLPHSRRVRRHGPGEHEDGRTALRHAWAELLPAGNGRVYHTYSQYARGLESTGGPITSSISPRSAGKRTGKSRRTAANWCVPPRPTSSHNPTDRSAIRPARVSTCGFEATSFTGGWPLRPASRRDVVLADGEDTAAVVNTRRAISSTTP